MRRGQSLSGLSAERVKLKPTYATSSRQHPRRWLVLHDYVLNILVGEGEGGKEGGREIRVHCVCRERGVC